jgi:integrase/recombinase XerC
MPTYSCIDLEACLKWKPKRWYEHRLYALICTLIDIGARIDIELLGLKRSDVDLDNLLIRLMGKGEKERYLPISIELPKVFYRRLKTRNHKYVFPKKKRHRKSHRNVLRDFYELCDQPGIKSARNSFHRFAIEYLRNGADELYCKSAWGIQPHRPSASTPRLIRKT